MKPTDLLPILLIVFLGSGLGDTGAETKDDSSNSSSPQLFHVEKIPCPDHADCLCMKLEATSDLVPLRSTYSRWCPAQAGNQETAKGEWKVTNYSHEWNKREEGHYLNGNMHDVWISWHPNGKKESEGHYKDGNPVGVHTKWHDNGTKAVTFGYSSGKPDGVWTC